jgi:DNA-binding IclR family transcriptional regulator
MTPQVSRDGSDARGNAALKSGIAVLRTFSSDESLLGVSEIAAKVGLHKSTVSRILATLEAEGLVERDTDSRRFQLGLGIIAMAGPLLADLDVRRVSYPCLRDLRRAVGETVALLVWDGTEAVCVEQLPSRSQVKHTTPLGIRYRDAASSSVQVFLAYADAFTVRRLVTSGAIDLPGADESALESLQRRLEEVAQRGYAVNYGETSVDEVGVAAPVFDHRDDPVAAVLVAAPRFRVSRDQVVVIADAARECAKDITQRLGGRVAAG